MERKELCEKDGILITYTDKNVCFENRTTAEAVLFDNDGVVLHTDFDAQKTECFEVYFSQIYPAVVSWRSLDSLETA